MHIVVLVTAPTPEVARAIARTLVDERLAACVNLIPQVTSIYRWEDAIHEDPELLLLIKTTEASFEALSARVHQLHPYTTPEVIALPISHGAAPYLAWLSATTEPPPPPAAPA